MYNLKQTKCVVAGSLPTGPGWVQTKGFQKVIWVVVVGPDDSIPSSLREAGLASTVELPVMPGMVRTLPPQGGRALP